MILVIGLIVSLGTPVLGSATTRQDPEGREKIRLQVQGFKTRDLLKVKLQDSSELQGCFRSADAEGFVIGPPFGSGAVQAEQKILFSDVSMVSKQKRGVLRKVLRGAVAAAYVGGVVAGVVKVGGDTTKTKIVKVWIGMGLLYPAAVGLSARDCR